MLHVLAAGLLLWLVAPDAGAQQKKLPDLAKLDLERAPDLESYSTYAWNKSQVPVDNLANHLRLINAIQDQMKAHGFRIDTVKPEMRIRYRVQLTEKLKGRSSQKRSVWDDANATVSIDFSREKEATLGIELIDAETNFILWRAEGTYRLGTADRAPKQIEEAVLDLFSRFPDRK